MFIVYLSGKLEKWLTLRMESERHFLWRKRVTSWTRLLKVLVERLDSSLNLSHRLNWKVILENTGHQIDLILQTAETGFPAQVILSSKYSLHVKSKHSHQLWSELCDEDNGSSVSDTDPAGLNGSKVGSVVSPSIVCSHSLSQIIWEVRGVRGSHTAEVNYRPGHTQFKRVGGHTHPAGNASDFLTVKCTVNSPL